MSFEKAEQLKQQLTGKYVVVEQGIAELKRFESLTGVVKTVNTNCRALVQFDGAVDISWYDIDPSYLTVVDQPVKKTAPAAKKESAAKAKPAKGAAKSSMSPLERARTEGAAGKKKPASTGKKPTSPLELARMQGAACSSKESSATPANKSAGKPAPAGGGDKPLSPLELARMQDSGQSSGSTSTAVKAKAEPQLATKTVPAQKSDGKPISKIELARIQGPFKG